MIEAAGGPAAPSPRTLHHPPDDYIPPMPDEMHMNTSRSAVVALLCTAAAGSHTSEAVSPQRLTTLHIGAAGWQRAG